MSLLQQGCLALLVSLGEAAPFILIGLLIAGIMREFVPARVLKKRLGGSGIAPVLRALGLGALLPICSCSTIPLGLGMARSGAGIGTTLAFMTSAPAISPITIILGISLLGPMLLGTYSLLVLCGSLLIGIAGNRLLSEGNSRKGSGEVPSSCNCGSSNHTEKSEKSLANAVHWALFDLGGEVALSLLVGLLLATIILVFTPSQWVLEIVGTPRPLAILAVILLAVPAYTCSVPALLIAGSLIAKGADPSVAVAFLIAGPATNFGELNSIRVGLGTRSAAFYFASVVLLAIISACLVQFLPMPSLAFAMPATESSQHHHHLHFGNEILDQHSMDLTASSIDPWRWPFICIILALAVHAVFAQHIKKKTKVNHSHKEKQPEMHRTDLLVVDRHASKGWEG